MKRANKSIAGGVISRILKSILGVKNQISEIVKQIGEVDKKIDTKTTEIENEITVLNNGLSEYKVSACVPDKMLIADNFVIAFNDIFTNIIFNGVYVKENISANSWAILISSFTAYTQGLNGVTIPVMILNSANIPIGTGIVLILNNIMILQTNVDISTTDKIFGSITKWCPR